eukprot:Lankesteria_metandrocarpae@DN5541_c0_g1_i1.p1
MESEWGGSVEEDAGTAVPVDGTGSRCLLLSQNDVSSAATFNDSECSSDVQQHYSENNNDGTAERHQTATVGGSGNSSTGVTAEDSSAGHSTTANAASDATSDATTATGDTTSTGATESERSEVKHESNFKSFGGTSVTDHIKQEGVAMKTDCKSVPAVSVPAVSIPATNPKDEKQDNSDADADIKFEENDPESDAVFDLFMNEVESIPKQSNRKRPLVSLFGVGDGTAAAAGTSTIVGDLGTGEEEVVRLISRIFNNSYDVLKVGPDTSEDAIKKQFRKMSLLIHPDKCSHEKADEAFDILNKAYEELQNPEFQIKYRKVLDHAKKLVVKARKAENANRKRRKEELLAEDEKELTAEITDKCEQILKEQEELRAYAERTRGANERREQDQEDARIEEEKKENEDRKLWYDTQNRRVEGWRGFQHDVTSRGGKFGGVQPLKHKREARAKHHGDPTATVGQKAAGGSSGSAAEARKTNIGIDDSYKRNWR